MLTCQVTCFSLENLLYRKAEKKRKFPERKRESHASNVLCVDELARINPFICRNDWANRTKVPSEKNTTLEKRCE